MADKDNTRVLGLEARVNIQEDQEWEAKVNIQEDKLEVIANILEDQESVDRVSTPEVQESVDRVSIPEDQESVDRVNIQEDQELEAKDLTQVLLLEEGLIITQTFCTRTTHTPKVGTDDLHSISPVAEVSSTNPVVIREP